MRRAAVPIVAALLLAGLAGCGTGSNRVSTRHFSSLCVDAGLPLSGAHAAAGLGVLAGLRREIPTTGLLVGGYRIRICQVFNDAAGSVTHAAAAAENVQTIAYVGELSSGQASLAEAVLAQAGIALITPSGPAPAPASSVSPGASGAARTTVPERTALYLLPSTRTQADAVADVRVSNDCARRRRGQPVCSVITPAVAPLCSGITTVSPLARPRYCVLAGPDLSSWTSPAVAYGDSAGQLLVSSLQALARAGRDVADRATVLHSLLHASLAASPLGAIRFDAQGAMEADDFTAYTVSGDGGLVSPESFRTH